MNKKLKSVVIPREQFDGFNGRKLRRYEFKGGTNVVAAHSVLLPKFQITLRVEELRKLIEQLDDADGLCVTVSAYNGTDFSFVREEENDEQN